MAEQTYIITNRIRTDGSFGADPEPRGGLHFLISPGRYVDDPAQFDERPRDAFRDDLLFTLRNMATGGKAAEAAIYIHGYNTDFQSALKQLREIGTNLAEHGRYKGLVVGFTWPSEGMALDYLEDRDRARESVTGFVHLMHLLKAIRMPPEQCFVNVSVLAHSMGNYVLREGLDYFWKHVGYPWNDVYFTQTLMFAADIAYDSLETGGSGQAIAGFSHRVTVYYSIHDDVLGLSTGAKHFGNRRLGRSGPADYSRLPENVAGWTVVAWPPQRMPLRSGTSGSIPAIDSSRKFSRISSRPCRDKTAPPSRTELRSPEAAGRDTS